MVKPGVECFLGDAEALQSWGQPQARPLSHSSQLSRLIDNQKQNKTANLAEKRGDFHQTYSLLDITDHGVTQLNLRQDTRKALALRQ